MSDDTSNVIGVRTVYDAVLRLEGKVEGQSARFDGEIDALRKDQTYMRGKIDGSIGMIKWLGPTGIVATLLGFLVMAGVLPVR